MAAALLPEVARRQVSHLSVRSQSKGQLSCCNVRAVSHLSVVQDLRDVARDSVTQIRNNGVLYFCDAPSLESLWDIRRQGGVIISPRATSTRNVE